MADSPRIATLLAQMAHPSLPGISPGLERMEALLKELGNPQKKLPPVVHIAGTNGKGSTLAYMRAAMEVAGLKVHAYTSPHLVHFRERIRLSGKLIEDAALERLLARVQAATEIAPVTFFEATTAAAFLAFAETPADVVLLETGMGGRLDATNLIPSPVLTIITAISKDHSEFLGDTVEAIAYEKAGIMKRNGYCISAGQPEAVRGVLFAQANKTGAKLRMGGRDWQWWAEGEKLHLRGLDEVLHSFPKPALAGAHQWPNAMLAAQCLLLLREHFPIKESHIAKGLLKASWPARLQKLPSLHPIRQALPMGSQLWLDGGHNEAAANAIADWMHAQAGQKFWLIWGMLKSKDAASFLRPLVPYVQGVVAVPVISEMSTQSAAELMEIARATGVAEVAEASDALQAAIWIDAQHPQQEIQTLIAGSLYLAGDVLALGGAPQ